MEEAIRKECLQFGTPLPPKLRNPPELMEGLHYYMDAFNELSTCRQVGFGEGPIPWTALAEWGKLHCNDPEELEILEHHVRALDRAYLKWRAAQQKESSR